ncbi:hypothetical protein UFOVP783_100 [uncultured Caudovirales phage]|uniref:Uncharacterized protein n=1 Tax=uncultured Caudovirales phage TaxID=2100421 RepID=A0A6J5NYB9_9CAUD|nr:hypothetical protein UFOVP783_100 [uncultured Caudovirales phage]
MSATATHPIVTCNLTGKLSTSPQIDAWVGDLDQAERDSVTLFLTYFPETPTADEIRKRAKNLAGIAERWVQRMGLPPETPVLIDAPGFLVATLARRLMAVGLKPVFAVLERNYLDNTDTLRFVEYVG